MMKPIVKKFGKRVRQLRLERDLTQEALGDKCGLDLSYIGRIERGEQNSSLVVIGMIAKGLGVSAEELFRGL
jgi:transcriptional regulator with XRE-family HTH domain